MKLPLRDIGDGNRPDTGGRACFGAAETVSDSVEVLLVPPRKLESILTGDEDKKDRGFSTLQVIVVPRRILV